MKTKIYEKTEYLDHMFTTFLINKEISKETRANIKELLLQSKNIVSILSNHFEFKKNLLDFSINNNKLTYYEKEKGLLYIEDGIYGKKGTQIKNITGFRLVKTSIQRNHVLENYKSNIVNENSIDAVMFLKEDLLLNLNPIIKKNRKKIQDLRILEKINFIDSIFPLKEIGIEINKILNLYEEKEINNDEIKKENDIIKEALEDLRQYVIDLISDIKVCFFNESFKKTLAGDFKDIDSMSEQRVDELLNKRDVGNIIFVWARNLKIFNNYSNNKDLLNNISVFFDEPEEGILRLSKLIKLLSKNDIFTRYSYENYDEIFGDTIDIFFRNWLDTSPETLLFSKIKEKTRFLYISSKSEDYIWEAKRNKVISENTLKESGAILDINETDNFLEIKVNKRILKYFLATNMNDSNNKIKNLFNLYSSDGWREDYLYKEELKLQIKKSEKLNGIDNYLLLEIILENVSDLTKSKEIKEMVYKMQRTVLLNNSLTKKNENRVKNKI